MVNLRVAIAVVTALLCISVRVASQTANERAALCQIWINLKPSAWVEAGFEPCRTDVDICEEDRTVKCKNGHVNIMFVICCYDALVWCHIA